ncbi:hypothetical protein MAR_010541 [Mya arenaria]|uniref:B box-type domain-containing protein n=1 Tax=Mya arenaria TaxID=6604 RepID=A0ABY7E5A7_MYAAR|nr:uncharacterized protein LOC128229718 [Mya arenaria]WAR03983.1 hypothetical protein MAR_010541 [Mya arenaria]
MMTEFYDSTDTTSDVVHDYTCTVCEERELNAEARIYCAKCLTRYCGPCNQHHAHLFAKHEVLDRTALDRWGVVRSRVGIETCTEHMGREVEMFCVDHEALCCAVCVTVAHRSCKNVKYLPIAAKGIREKEGFKSMPQRVNELMVALEEIKQDRVKSSDDIGATEGRILSSIEEFQVRINLTIERLKVNTIESMAGLTGASYDGIRTDVQTCNVFLERFEKYMKAMQSTCSKSEAGCFTCYMHCLDCVTEATSFVKSSRNAKFDVSFEVDSTIEEFLNSLKSFGEFKTMTINSTKCSYIKLKSDDKKCSIVGCCQVSDNAILLADETNRKIKLLNDKYSIVHSYELSSCPCGVCCVSEREAAVCLEVRAIQYVSVHDQRLTLLKRFSVDHDCLRLTYHGGKLFVTSGTALYTYTLNGKLEKKLYQGKNNALYFTVNYVAVSEDGRRIFVTNANDGVLVTLDGTGTILAILQDPTLHDPRGLCVGPGGTVLVCGLDSDTLLHVDRGGRKLAVLATQRDGLLSPVAVCWRQERSEILVGCGNNDFLIIIRLI